MKMSSNNAASSRERVFSLMPGINESLQRAKRSSATKMPSGMSRRLTSRPIVNGKMVAVTPSMSRMLQMLEPTTLPMATSPCPVIADDTEMNNSGADVPMPTTVSPMMKLDIRAR